MLFSDRLSLALTNAQRHRQKFAVMILDLDRFKSINDSLGHTVGDEELRLVGARLKGLLRKSDTVARMGGDEFILLLPEITCTDDVTGIAQKILRIIREPIEFDGHSLDLSTSIGIALYPDNGEDGDIVMKRADIALYDAKNKRRGIFQSYSEEMES